MSASAATATGHATDPPTVDRADPLAVLQAISADLGAGRPERVAALLETLPDRGGVLGRALLGIARGLEAEAEGRGEDAARLMEEAFGRSPTLPAAALRVLVSFFGRTGRRLLAHHAFLMLQVLEPGALEESARDLPPDERARYVPWAMRASIDSGRQATYHLAAAKAALRGRLGPEGAALVLAGVRGPQGARRAVRRTLTPLLEHLRAQGAAVEELIAAGPTPDTWVSVFGPPSEHPGHRRLGRAVAAGRLSDVVVTGRSGILLTGELALMDVQDDELTRRPQDLSVDPLVAGVDDEGLLLLEPQDREALPSVPEAVWLGGVHSVAFGHWIIEFLPKLWALMTRQGFGRVPLLVDGRMPAQHLEAVRLFASADNPVIELQAHESIRVERLWVSTALDHLPVGPLPTPAVVTRAGLDDAGFRRLMARIRPALEAIDAAVAVGPGPPRIHLTRKPSQHRSLVNAHQLQAGLDAAGFVPYDFGDLPFAEQLRLVRGAEWIIGPAGSALENVIFGRPGLRVGVLVPNGPENIDWLGQCCRALGIELTAIVGEVVQPHSHYRWMSGYRVDQELLAAYLRAVPGTEAADGRTGPLRKVAAIRVWADDAVTAPVDVPS